MHGFDFGGEYVSGQQSHREHSNQQRKGEPAERFSRVNHFAKEMRESNEATNEIHREESFDEVLGDDAEVIVLQRSARRGKDGFHSWGKNPRRHPERKKDGGTEPNGCVENSDGAQ